MDLMSMLARDVLIAQFALLCASSSLNDIHVKTSYDVSDNPTYPQNRKQTRQQIRVGGWVTAVYNQGVGTWRQAAKRVTGRTNRHAPAR